MASSMQVVQWPSGPSCADAGRGWPASPASGGGLRVRCLGWEHLEQPYHTLYAAVTSTLGCLSVPYDMAEDGVFVAQPPQPTDDGEAPPSLELRVTIHISAADGAPGKHHVSLRRTQGGHWRFRAFYTAFRSEFAPRI